jgi:hypothetical protein
MIESINNAGSSGGGTDELAKVSANDTTAGYLNGKLVAGAGISLTENNNGGNETLGIAVANLDASAITTGTVATARLGTGTANSSTYLAGDQTYKAAVTSVNGQTGAVTVAGGDTTYTVTTADAENTTTVTNLVSFTVPANTWAEGEFVFVEFNYRLNNTTGSANYTQSLTIGGFLHTTSSTAGLGAGEQYNGSVRHWFFREGTSIRALSLVGQPHIAFAQPSLGNSLVTVPYFSTASGSTLSATFSSNITINIRGQWSAADAGRYQRILNARAWKPAGQTT